MYSVKPVLLDSVKNYLPLSSHRLNYLKTTFLRDRRSILLWSGFGLFCVFTFHFLSDGDFSFLLVWLGVFSSVDVEFGSEFVWVLLGVVQGVDESICGRYVWWRCETKGCLWSRFFYTWFSRYHVCRVFCFQTPISPTIVQVTGSIGARSVWVSCFSFSLCLPIVHSGSHTMNTQ